MQLTVKDLKQNSHVFTDIESDQTVANFAEEVKKVFNYTDSVRLIYCGKILEHNKLLSEYFKEVNTGFIVCMPEKTKTETPQKSTQMQSQPQPQQNTTITSPRLNTNPNLPRLQTSAHATANTTQNASSNNGTYTTDQIRAILLVFTRFIKVSPELFYLFSTNDAAFQSFILSPTFTNQVLQPLLESSSNVTTALQNGTDVAVEIPIYGTPNNTHVNNTNTNINTTNVTNNETTGTDEVPDTTSLFDIPQTNDDLSTTLTEQDKQNIKDLCEFGFQENYVTRVYLIANRNKEVAASMLYELGDMN